MKNFHNAQIAIGKASRSTGALHRAWAVASELYATWKWDGRGRIVIHDPYETHRQMQCSQKLGYSRRGSTNVHAGVHTLTYGEHYEIKPLAVEACRRLDIDEDRALSAEEAEQFKDYLTPQDPSASLLIWHDGAKETAPDEVQAVVKPDTYGVTVSVYRDGAEHDDGEVLVEFYAGRVVAHVWNEEDKGGDPTASVELFTL